MASALDKYADMKPNWDYPVVIESHINGIRTKEMNPNTPISYDEIAEDAIRCWEAGAGAIHAHNTSFDLLGENAYKDYMRTWDRVLEKHPSITWYLPRAITSDSCRGRTDSSTFLSQRKRERANWLRRHRPPLCSPPRLTRRAT